nr:calcium-binding mitochondrial carrier protein SCaMC-3 isoform X1 [Bactrocera oleae]XP_036216596.1 calcium-binding mitochondrial carrier protein SCaMC-3 isoform X1 [Bactrocera oleae]XP_036216600.1 calcium-binding mitochondrial carrier protein SCaMC-3 isoform X1 [Bactrocera oleae]XP_036216616.1 calcium-binding mitochondrial carrier protein SCaMC-3 isoform X1 [Bactrocera oleae]XP_036216624.1 calcium-binding mitochondrial carrier protein SCaMC-3 isoform X1 [Bactrocera oleae]XP_036216633.1 calci
MVDKDEDKNIVTNNIAHKQEQNKIAQKSHNLSSTAPTTTTSTSLQNTSNAAASSGASCNQIAANSSHLVGSHNHPKLIPIQSVLNTTDSHHQNTTAATHQAKGHDNTTTFPQFITGGASGAHTQVATELPHEDEERLEKLFNTLDRDGNGRIDIHDLSEALREFGLSSVYAEKFLEQSDINQSGDVGLAEFVFYVREHEKNLRLQFSHLDKNKDGKVDLEELIDAFKDLGIEVDPEEATNLLSRIKRYQKFSVVRMDQDGSLNISFNEWRDFLLLAPSTDIHDLIKFWRHSTYLDIGEDLNVPDDFTQSEMQTGMWWRHLAAGGIAGAVSRTCTAPLDRIKVYLQVQTHKAGISDSLRYMLNEGGLRSMWRGNGINVLKIAPESAIKFAAYEKIKRLIRGDEKRQMTIGERFMAGAAAGGISQTIIYPMEVLKTRLALRKTGQYKGILDAAKKIYLMEGVRSFYRGYIPNMLGIIPYAGIDLAVYETLKKKYLSSHNTEQPSFLVLLACGSASSTLGQVCSYPLALVRTRLQAQVITKNKLPSVGIPLRQAGAINDDNMFGVFRKILHNEGICGLYRGITPNFIKVLPAVSISYVVYEYSSRALGVNMT